jgi:hypothetical protein
MALLPTKHNFILSRYPNNKPHPTTYLLSRDHELKLLSHCNFYLPNLLSILCNPRAPTLTQINQISNNLIRSTPNLKKLNYNHL